MSNYTKHRIVIHYYGVDLKTNKEFTIIPSTNTIYIVIYVTEEMGTGRIKEPFSGNSWIELQHMITFHKYQ